MKRLFLSFTVLATLLFTFTACDSENKNKKTEPEVEKDYIRISDNPHIKTTFGFFFAESFDQETGEIVRDIQLVLMGGMTYQEFMVMSMSDGGVLTNDLAMFEIGLLANNSDGIPTADYVFTSSDEYVINDMVFAGGAFVPKGIDTSIDDIDSDEYYKEVKSGTMKLVNNNGQYQIEFTGTFTNDETFECYYKGSLVDMSALMEL